MADKHMFDNDDVFTKDGNIDNTVTLDTSETLATQGNVINSLKIFWARLKTKLVHAITRGDTSKAVGGDYQPIYVNSNGEVTACTPTFYSKTIINGKIDLPNEFPLYSGQIVCINVSNSTGSNNVALKIKDVPVYYPTNVAVIGSDINNGVYMFSYIGGEDNKWILNNKINVASDTNSGLMTAAQYSKLKGISDNANYFTYTLPTASANEKGGVKSSSNNDTDSNQKTYHVGVDTNGIMTVNVPWQNTHNTAYLRAGGNNNNNEATTNGNTYLKIVDGSTTSKIKISGSEGTSVSSDSSGNITIQSSRVTTYNVLDCNNNSSSGDYLISGPGPQNANTNYFLAGNGTWVKVISVPASTSSDSGKILKCGSDGKPYWANANE